MNEKTDSLEQQLNSQINAELSSLWYYTDLETNSTRLIIKTTTPCIKALVIGCPLKLLFGKKDNYLCIGVRIIDIPDGAMFISKVQCKSEEHRALIYALEKGKFDISLVNEMDKTVANGKIAISKAKSIEILNWLNNENDLYVGEYTKDVDFVHDCFCVSVEDLYRYKAPKAYKIPYIELEATTDSWKTIDLYFYESQNMYDFNIADRNEGENFEQEIASALISVFPSTLYKNAKYKKGNTYEEFTDIFTFYKYGSFLIEAKDTSVIKSGFYISKERRILNVQKQVKKAIKQLTGAAKVFMEGTEIYTNDNKKINVNRAQPPHCIILITEFIHNGDWSEVENLLFDAVNKTNAMFHLMDLKEFIELLKASSGRAEIMDYNLMQRFKYVIENYKHM